MPIKAREIFNERLKLFNTSIEDRCKITNAIKFYPKV